MFDNFIDYLRGNKKKSAAVAKERLLITLAHERAGRSPGTPDYLPALKAELMEVIGKYVKIDPSQIEVNLEKHEDYDVLELNVTLPEGRG